MIHHRRAVALAAFMVLASALPAVGRAAELNLAAITCDKYENEVIASTSPGTGVDPIDTVMWLFGFSVARSGEHIMYGDSLPAFGFALDAECKNNPMSTLLAAVSGLKSQRKNPMDLTQLNCLTFESRHTALRKTDAESATTLSMWLFGYSTGLTDHHILDADGLGRFDDRLDDYCTKHPGETLYDALSALGSAAAPSQSPSRK